MGLRANFTNAQNQQFLQSNQFIHLEGIRRTFAIFAILYALFGFLDPIFFPTTWGYFWALRFVVVVVLISTYVLSYKKRFLAFHQYYFTFNFIVGGVVIALMLIANPENMVYYGGMFIVYFSGYFIVSLRFKYALIGGWSVFVFHIIGTLLFSSTISDVFIYSSIFLVGANLIGMIGAYNIEKSNRDRFLKDLSIEQATQSLSLKTKETQTHLEQLQAFILENEELNTRFKQRDQLLKQLQSNEQFIQELTTQTKIMFYEINLEGMYTKISKSVTSILGYTPDEIVNKYYFYDLFPEDVKQKYQKIQSDVMGKEEIKFDFINPLVSKSGEIIWVRSHIYPVYDESTHLVLYRGSDKDITSEKNAVDELELFKTMTEQAQFGSALSTIDGTLVYVNEAICAMMGYTKSELIGQHIQILHSDDQIPQVRRLHDQLLKNGGFVNEELGHLRKNKEVFPAQITGKVIYIDGTPSYYSATLFDITKEKEIQSKLWHAQTQLEKIIAHNDVPIANHQVIFDNEGKPIDYQFIYVNPAYEKMMGMDKSQIIGKTVLELMPDTEDYWIQEFSKVAMTQVPERYTNYAKEFDKWFSVSVYSPNEGEFAVLITDVTSIIKHEEELEYISKHDDLTSIPNRYYFNDTLPTIDKEANYPIAIMMMDINGLKLINDSFGIEAGNVALKQVSSTLQLLKKETDFIARIGSDEFVMICPRTTLKQIQEIKKRISEQISTFVIHDIQYSLAIGFEVKQSSDQALVDVLKRAENNLFKDKIIHGQSTRGHAIMSIFATLTNKYFEEQVHSTSVSRYCRLIGEQLHLPERDLAELALAGKLHDIGKIAIPDDVLKKPGKLSVEEWKVMMDHTINGYEILRAADEYSDLATYALTHHERIDGRGYPNGLAGNDIPLFSRIICIADAFEAMTSDRVYKKAIKMTEAIQELIKHSGTQFDEELVSIFINEVLSKELPEINQSLRKEI
ncbi:MAG: PAS domain S-box protein [Candidatus Izemoplasmatales bacterium]|nr:PAS domain S-box protein [Candidatus Izemoplasmatales bacterium]